MTTDPFEILHEFLRVQPGEDVTRRYDAKQAQAAVSRIEEQKEASDALLREAFELIWHEDAPYVEGGTKKLDDLAVKIGRYLGVNEDELIAPPAPPAFYPAMSPES